MAKIYTINNTIRTVSGSVFLAESSELEDCCCEEVCECVGAVGPYDLDITFSGFTSYPLSDLNGTYLAAFSVWSTSPYAGRWYYEDISSSTYDLTIDIRPYYTFDSTYIMFLYYIVYSPNKSSWNERWDGYFEMRTYGNCCIGCVNPYYFPYPYGCDFTVTGSYTYYYDYKSDPPPDPNPAVVSPIPEQSSVIMSISKHV